MHAFLTDKIDLPASPDTLEIHPDTSIGIEEIRTIQNFLSRKPAQSPRNTVVIFNAELLTTTAQHAILKTLEEPPGNSQIYLLTSQPNSLLPTILSRVELLPTIIHTPQTPDFSFITSLLAADSFQTRLTLMEAQAFTRESSLSFLADLEQYTHQHLIVSNPHLASKIYHLVSDTRKYLKSNCNVKLILDHFVIELTG